jgi:hypothetical protein
LPTTQSADLRRRIRGPGVNILATVQATSHYDVVYGPKYADALREIFPATMIMYGAHERHCSNSHHTGWVRLPAAPNPTNPIAEVVRSPRNSAKLSAGKNCCRRVAKKLNYCCAAPPVSASRFPTGASSSRFSTKPSAADCKRPDAELVVGLLPGSNVCRIVTQRISSSRPAHIPPTVSVSAWCAYSPRGISPAHPSMPTRLTTRTRGCPVRPGSWR